MIGFSFEQHAHRRFNPLTGEYIQVSPHRNQRPWQGQQEKVLKRDLRSYKTDCFLCPGNARMGGERNPDYPGTFVFTNDFGALNDQVPEGIFEDGEFFKAKSEKGICKVVCFSPNHSLTIPDLSLEEVINVVCTWRKEYKQLGAISFINYIQIFENKGEVMGCSNPHPHGQIWAQESIPDEPAKKQLRFFDYFKNQGKNMIYQYVQEELVKKERMVYENDKFVVLVPFWAIWPFETMIAPKEALSSLAEMDHSTIENFADAYKKITMIYDRLFDISFPYSAGIHQAPTDGIPHPEWGFHMVFYPPLLRSATIKKFMVGYEMLANPQRDLTAEKAAEILRNA